MSESQNVLETVIGALLTVFALLNRMVEVFKNPQVNSFSCVSPLNLNA